MTTLKRIFETTNEGREAQKLSIRNLLNISQKRAVWNNRRRFSY